MKKTHLRKIIQEEVSKTLKEQKYSANFDVVARKRLGDLADSLKNFQRRTTSDVWKKKLTSAIKDLKKLEDKFVKVGTELGSIPLK